MSVDIQEVYHGDRTACSVEGLLFDAEYRTRVKAINRVGCSAYSAIVRIQTAKGCISRYVCADQNDYL